MSQPNVNDDDTPLVGEPRKLERSEHNISRKAIDSDALKVMYRLIQNGHMAFLVGGGVRDLLLEKAPKDFDIGTEAKPETVRRLFRNSRVIGRRFKINHVYFRGGKVIEVATFRDLVEEPITDVQTRKDTVPDNIYGNPETDALRRDLTINGLFYDPRTFRVIDYVGGIDDLRAGVIRIIREPERRILEDPVRMIRAIRHAARTSFTIEPKTFAAICKNAQLIELSSKPRVNEEFMRELRGGHSAASFSLLKSTGLLPYLMPLLAEMIAKQGDSLWNELQQRLTKLDRLSQLGTELAQSVMFSSLLVGNIKPQHLGDEDEEYIRAVEPFFFDTERLKEWSKDSEARERFEEAASKEVPPKPRGGRRRGVSLLMRAINEVFLPLGVTRKEREKLEAMLRLRYRLLVEEPDERLLRQIARLPHLGDTLALVRLTSSSRFGKALNERIEPMLRDAASQGRSERRRRRRKSRRRNRKRGDKK